MTIAVGLRCQDGILLCADTEHTGYSAKSHHAKLDRFDIYGGNICFALAGASALAWSAVQKCKTELQTASADVIGHIEETLDREYRRNVFGHPNYSGLDYQLLLGVWLTDKRPRLFCTTATAMTEVQDFECIGIGAELAAYLIRPGFPVSTFHDALSLTAYTMACVKDGITGCGGMSIYILLRNDGNTGLLTSRHLGPAVDVEEYAKVLDFNVRRLLMWMGNPKLEDKYFEKNLIDLFAKDMLQTRSKWSNKLEQRMNELAEANPDLTPNQVRALFDDLSLGFTPKASYPK